MYHSSFKIQKPKLKNRNIINHVGCKWFHGNEDPAERLINIEYNDAVQLLIFYWPDNQQRQPIPLENIIMPCKTIPPDRVVLRIRIPYVNAINNVELRFPTSTSLDQFMVYITPERYFYQVINFLLELSKKMFLIKYESG